MSQQYFELNIELPMEFSELLMAELDQIGYDSFEEVENGLKCYVEKSKYSEQAIEELKIQYQELFAFTVSLGELEDKNWNEEWEKKFEQTIVNDDCIIRASFHEIDRPYKYEIVIDPCMSFGTGHHATTTMMAWHELEMNFEDKKVLDAGCGTGVLAILAAKRGATDITAYDIDEWSYNNAIDNFEVNKTQEIKILQGDVSCVSSLGKFDVILANINKNVLLKDIGHFAEILNENGYLVLSGFYENDIKDLLSIAHKNGLSLDNQKNKDDWASLRLLKE